MFVIGSHLSISKGYLHMGQEASSIGANTFQFFSRNPRGGQVRAFDEADMKALVAYMEEHNFGRLLAHAPYTLNACAAKPDLREFAKNSMREDLERMEYIPGNMYNFHPGSHVKQGMDQGIEYIIDCLNEVMFPGMKTTVLLEAMAGKGTEVGSKFEELARIIDGVKLKEYLGVCVDTCHIHEGGYDIVNNLEGVLDEFDSIVGIDRLHAIHLNDSKNPIGAHKDRHEKIGEGHIGIDAIARIVTHPKLTNLPFYLETPNELDGYAKEIAMLRSIVDNA
ncbi:MAG: deoxyribonuclease IV [Veillonella sp.]|jgi:deoxyribonuclease-4|uniref:deoxyribonuclease IV n=1 Tax=Veillonella sp. TaxID=1926307 RepID=UPI001B6514DA|nr:deoxyribonuclease IV [Veillonella sp.]NCB95721.1 deoxyribonuclease IV [Negativicutes bacterium]MBK7920855.1 deoxyribonuclease IV [Veillonella sp.]MBP6923479.1 deoxyribonuclease IV [Veillonella sp.]MBP8616922.1 deoxyribonuclease IV [Veillonella sp.]MBP9517071.1 deoxyribonuclease IV [Veillonella sp.]